MFVLVKLRLYLRPLPNSSMSPFFETFLTTDDIFWHVFQDLIQITIKYDKQSFVFNNISRKARCRDLFSLFKERMGSKIPSNARMMGNGRFLRMCETIEEVRLEYSARHSQDSICVAMPPSRTYCFIDEFVKLAWSLCVALVPSPPSPVFMLCYQAGLTGHCILEVHLCQPGGARGLSGWAIGWRSNVAPDAHVLHAIYQMIIQSDLWVVDLCILNICLHMVWLFISSF